MSNESALKPFWEEVSQGESKKDVKLAIEHINAANKMGLFSRGTLQYIKINHT